MLRKDTLRLAKDKGYNVQSAVFDEAEDFSPFVADLYRWWYQQRGIPANRLLVEMFFLIEPYWALRTGSVPFWLAFNAQGSATAVKRYLSQTNPFDEIYLLPFSNGVDGKGLATADDLRTILAHARQIEAFLGSEPSKCPFDFGIYARYEKALKSHINTRCTIAETLSLSQLRNSINQAEHSYNVAWVD